MPLNIPNTLIYLAALLRPTRLKPDLRIPSISHVDWKRARRQGYNAVVIDKDNCLVCPVVIYTMAECSSPPHRPGV